MQRRSFLALLGLGTGATLLGCDAGTGPDSPTGTADAGPADASSLPGDTSSTDACMPAHVLVHDTNAQALYLDGTLGPLTGVIRVVDIVAGAALTLDFWHGHGGQQHRFTLTPAVFDQLKRGEKVTIGTTMVDGHSHTLFIDPLDEDYRVTGAPDVSIDLGC